MPFFPLCLLPPRKNSFFDGKIAVITGGGKGRGPLSPLSDVRLSPSPLFPPPLPFARGKDAAGPPSPSKIRLLPSFCFSGSICYSTTPGTPFPFLSPCFKKRASTLGPFLSFSRRLTFLPCFFQHLQRHGLFFFFPHNAYRAANPEELIKRSRLNCCDARPYTAPLSPFFIPLPSRKRNPIQSRYRQFNGFR